MSLAFSTESIPIVNRNHGWQGKVREICGDCRFQFPKRYPFHGSIDIRSVGAMEIMRFASTPLSFTEFPSEAAESRTHCIVTTQLEGVRRYSQDGHAAVLEARDSTLIDCARPWSSESSGDSVRLYLRIPRELLANRVGTRKFPTAPRIVGNAGLGATLFQIAISMFREAEMFQPAESTAAVEAYFDILSACLRHSDVEFDGRHHGKELFSRVLSFIETHLAEPTLGPLVIAYGCGISVRHLHRVFAVQGCSVGQWIRQRRLQQCWNDIGHLRFRNRSITEIAFSWGFSDSAHFSRSFRKEFGINPRALRASNCGKSWRDDQNTDVENLSRGNGAAIYPKPN